MILALNVGSTSVKIALAAADKVLCQESFPLAIADRETLFHQDCFAVEVDRLEEAVCRFLSSCGRFLEEVAIVVSRGGLQRPGDAGSYLITEPMLDDLRRGTYGKHPSSLGPVLAARLALRAGCLAVAVDPPSTDEFIALARPSGLPDLERVSAFHALSHKAAGRQAAAALGKEYDHCRLIVAHLGGGITVGAHCLGKVIDCTNGLSEGPFSPERAGSLPTMELFVLALAHADCRERFEKRLVGEGGLQAYLGTKDALVVEQRIADGDNQAALIYETMAYQIAKDIGSMAAVLAGQVDAVVLTGSLARSAMLLGWLRSRIEFLGPLFIYPGECEMTALLATADRVLAGEEKLQSYPP
ncbi:MAG: butyrate kinase [Deltaproteobacteria bacterium]|nr:butyrate kinase [Candidatus Anaeroferrophillus wilburensis]MBN2888953.1 butyrate kinase [Deltaproteobacteria bacterium]